MTSKATVLYKHVEAVLERWPMVCLSAAGWLNMRFGTPYLVG
jgi:hypothetical protein